MRVAWSDGMTSGRTAPTTPPALLALVFLAALLFGCATPAPVYRLDPRTPDVIWVGGRASVHQEQANVRVAAAFEQQYGDHLGLRIEVANGTESRLEISPEKIWYSVCSSSAVASCRSERVVNPEGMIAGIDDQRSIKRASATNDQAALATLVMLNVVAGAASAATDRGNGTDHVHVTGTANQMELRAARHGREQASLEHQRHVWSNEALRKNSLFPGQGTTGIVFLPVVPAARFVWLQIRVGGQKFAFQFEQNVRQVERPAPRGRLLASDG
jgi:hypothetical protein